MLKRPDDLRGTLMLGFAALAILPMVLAVVLITHIAESGIAISTGELASISRAALSDTSDRIGVLAQQQIEKTGRQLTEIGSQAVRKTSDALLSASEKRFQDANHQLINQGEKTNQALATQLIGQSKDATNQLAKELIGISQQSNHELAADTSKMAEGAIVSLSDRLVDQAYQNTHAISDHIVEQNQLSAQRLSEKMVADVTREPVVNFKTLALIFARGIATDKVTAIGDGYLAVVNPAGRVIASTRYPKWTSLRRLAIVQEALDTHDPENHLYHFKDGNEDYLGVFARRDDGGAVIFAYLADRARVDTERMKQDVQTTLGEMSRASSEYVIGRVQAERPLMRQQAAQLSKQAIAQLAATSRALSDRTTARMRSRADAVSAKAVSGMTSRATALANTSAAAMNARAQGIAADALNAMRPIGQQYSQQAEQAMRAQAAQAVKETSQIVPRAAAYASQKATAHMAPEAHRLAERAKHQMWLIAGGLLLLEVVIGILASLLMSGRIAAPILTAQQQAREEQERLTREMEIASRIQTCLLPPVPTLDDFDVAVAMMPAEEVGGDFVDLILDPAAPGAFWMGIGDVTGHGLTPGLIMMMAQSVFNSLTRTPGMTPKSVYDGMNRVLYQNIKDRLKTSDHMTVSVLKHEQDGSFVHCGSHLDILIYRHATGQVERVQTDGPWVGMLPACEDFTFETRFALDAEDVLLLYTDGLIEVQNAHQEQWDMDRLCESLARHAGREAREIQQAVMQDSLQWANRVLDDISMIVVKRSATALSAVVPKAEPRTRSKSRR